MKFVGSADWTAGRGPYYLQIAIATFGILALELTLIRWMSVQIRIFAYFNNIILIGAFLGMGLGVALGRRHPRLLHWTLPVLALLSIPLAFSEAFHIVHLPFPDGTVALWGAETQGGGLLQAAKVLSIFLGLFALVVAVFVFAGSAVGQLFFRIPTLRAYSADLGGSLLGVGVFTAATFFDAGPAVWLLIGGVGILWLSRSFLSLIGLVVAVALGWYSMGDAIFSPYNRIDVARESAASVRIDVNRDFHQFMHDLSDAALRRRDLPPGERERIQRFRAAYDIPFRVSRHRDRALIVGAGSGNDVQAALRGGFQQVYSVDIDGRIMDLGARHHPEKPFGDRRVVRVVDDARAFFEQYDGDPFDVVSYGLLDSHAMFSSMSSLRLDNYVYTEEGLRSAWRHVSDRGILSLSFSIFSGPWIFDRIFWTLQKATGVRPVAFYHGMHYGATFIVAKPAAKPDLAQVGAFKRLIPSKKASQVRTTSDDWPFLYIRPGSTPWAYVLILLAILVMALLSTLFAFGRGTITKNFDGVLFCMGAAFLLIETRGVTSLSLVFGSTWVVNSAIFAGVLAVVLVANIFVLRYRIESPNPWFAALLLSVVLLWLFQPSMLNQLPMGLRGLVGGLVNALPIGFAGVIVSIVLARSDNPTASLGSNILGSVVGGCCEYLSMALGLQALVLVALCFYLLALLLLTRRESARMAPVDYPLASSL